jgi:hypothetical protein
LAADQYQLPTNDRPFMAQSAFHGLLDTEMAHAPFISKTKSDIFLISGHDNYLTRT